MTATELKKELKKRHITYKELAESSGIPESTLKNIFSFRTANPRIDTIRAIENSIGFCRTDDVFNTERLREDELRLLVAYNALVPAMRDYILSTVENLTAATAVEKKA